MLYRYFHSTNLRLTTNVPSNSFASREWINNKYAKKNLLLRVTTIGLGSNFDHWRGCKWNRGSIWSTEWKCVAYCGHCNEKHPEFEKKCLRNKTTFTYQLGTTLFSMRGMISKAPTSGVFFTWIRIYQREKLSTFLEKLLTNETSMSDWPNIVDTEVMARPVIYIWK